MLYEHPRLGRQVPEFNQADLREVLVSPYRIVYRVKDEDQLVEIVRVWHAARDTPEL